MDGLVDLAVDSLIISKLLLKEVIETQALPCCCKMLFQKPNTTPVSVVTLNTWPYLDVRQIEDITV